MNQDNENRPLRVRMEVMLIKLDLWLSVTNKGMNEVKARAGRSMDGEENQEAAEENMKSEDSSRSKSRGKSRSKSVDSMSGISINNVVPFCAANSVHPPSDIPSCCIEWEVLTEKSLIECLNFAASCVEDDRIAILTKAIVHRDWLAVASLQQKASTKSTPQSPSPLHPCHSSTNMSNDEDSNLDSSITLILIPPSHLLTPKMKETEMKITKMKVHPTDAHYASSSLFTIAMKNRVSLSGLPSLPRGWARCQHL